ncbi:T9SS type A sorting domain-containing protein [Hymenobacter sp. B81]|uniref:T9SS type A sorting domain-containing protein n=1 Tax=Hymenobacter sp. B81 TaxID=3344878 RepID=UPI0037DDAE5B
MKKPILALLGLLAYASAAQAQTLPHSRLPRPGTGPANGLPAEIANEAARPTATVRKAARISTYSWVASGSRWATPANVTMQTFSVNGDLLTGVTTDSATQRPVSRFTYVRDTAGRISSYLSEIWNGTAWQNSTRYVNVRDARGNITEQTHDNWVSNAWRGNTRQVVSYTAQNQYLQRLIYYDNAGSWSLYFDFQYTYDGTHRLTQMESAYPSSGLATTRTHYSYPGVGTLPNGILYQEKQGNMWVDKGRELNHVYDGQQRITSYELQQWDGLAWQPQERGTYTYDTATLGSQSTFDIYQSGTWQPASRSTNSYDPFGNHLGTVQEQWSGTAWNLQMGTREFLGYNATDDVVRRLSQRVPVPGNPRVFVNQTKTYYSNFQSFVTGSRAATALQATATLHPNPSSSGRATLAVSGLHGAATATVLDALGRQVLSQQLRPVAGSAHWELSVADQPAGLYLVRLTTDEGTVVKRLIKQ